MENIDRQIRYFLKIADRKSLSRAADSLDLTQSGLSKQLAALEMCVGKPLFSRTGRGVELTDTGKVLLDAAKTGYAIIDEALETVLMRRLRWSVRRGDPGKRVSRDRAHPELLFCCRYRIGFHGHPSECEPVVDGTELS